MLRRAATRKRARPRTRPGPGPTRPSNPRPARACRPPRLPLGDTRKLGGIWLGLWASASGGSAQSASTFSSGGEAGQLPGGLVKSCFITRNDTQAKYTKNSTEQRHLCAACLIWDSSLGLSQLPGLHRRARPVLARSLQRGSHGCLAWGPAGHRRHKAGRITGKAAETGGAIKVRGSGGPC